MHDIDTTQLETDPALQAGETFETSDAAEADSIAELSDSLSEAEEMELATDLLSVTNEAEMDQFLGKLFKKAWKGIKKVGSAIGKVARPFAGVLKGIAKKALPVVGGALGSFIPIPGVGTAVGSALGSAVSKALELELEGLEPEDREFEMARRFVRLSHDAARQLARTDPRVNPRAAILSAVKCSLQKQQAQSGAGTDGQRSQDGQTGAEFEFEFETSAAPTVAGPKPRAGTGTARPRPQTGRWVRQGNQIILTGI